MGERALGRCRLARAGAVVAFAGLVGACASEAPAPVVMNGGAPGVAGYGSAMSGPGTSRESRRIIVRPGQSLSRLAVEYHVSQHAIVAANHLTPPYKIEIGQQLLIPGAMPARGEAIAAAPPAPARSAAPVLAAHPSTDIIPLDGPPPPRPAAPPPAAASRPPGEPSAADEARAEAAPSASAPAASASHPHLPWPVHGHVLASYGVAAGGARNDGINIAAQKGAPVRAVDAGIVAYAGNELRGYGNLVLVKHQSGFISAYAHCEELLVKKGDRVAQGQVIAKVGATGGVSEPQLHFELRRGKSAVDPRQFLAPAPSAALAAPPRG